MRSQTAALRLIASEKWQLRPDGEPVEASSAATLPVQTSETKTWLEAFVVLGSALHLVSRRWLSQHRCLVNFDPNNLCMESPELGSVPLVLHSSGRLLLSLESLPSALEQHTAKIDFQNSSPCFVRGVQRRDEQTAVAISMDSSQQREHVVNKRAEPDDRRVADPPVARDTGDHPTELSVSFGRSERGDHSTMAERPPRLVVNSSVSVATQSTSPVSSCL